LIWTMSYHQTWVQQRCMQMNSVDIPAAALQSKD
jgi:hypothetical protein